MNSFMLLSDNSFITFHLANSSFWIEPNGFYTVCVVTIFINKFVRMDNNWVRVAGVAGLYVVCPPVADDSGARKFRRRKIRRRKFRREEISPQGNFAVRKFRRRKFHCTDISLYGNFAVNWVCCAELLQSGNFVVCVFEIQLIRCLYWFSTTVSVK